MRLTVDALNQIYFYCLMKENSYYINVYLLASQYNPGMTVLLIEGKEWR